MAKIQFSIGGTNHTHDGENIQIRNGKIFINGVDVHASDKYVVVENVQVVGDVAEVSTTHGNVAVSGIAGAVSTMSGDVECQNVGGSISTMSGDVDCKAVSGNITTMSGDVKVRA